MVICATVMISVYVCIFWSERQVIHKFGILRASMRPSAKRLHTDIHNALVALAVCPIISMIVPTNLFLIAVMFHINMGLVSPLLIVMVTSVTLLSPMTTCYFVRPFRRYVARAVFSTDAPCPPQISSVSSTDRSPHIVRDISSIIK